MGPWKYLGGKVLWWKGGWCWRKWRFIEMSWGIFELLLRRRNDLGGSLDWSRRFFFSFWLLLWGCWSLSLWILQGFHGMFSPPPLPLVSPRCPFFLDLLSSLFFLLSFPFETPVLFCWRRNLSVLIKVRRVHYGEIGKALTTVSYFQESKEWFVYRSNPD